MKTLLALLASVTILLPSARAEWPERVFAPYMFTGEGDGFQLTAGDDACGLRYYTLAFVIAQQSGRGHDVTYQPVPAWYGSVPVETGAFADQIDAIRQRGGDVIVSFGGEAGKELACVITDPAQLQAAYQGIVDRHRLTWLDFDIEGKSLDRAPEDNSRRNAVLAALQRSNPGLRISYTLPASPNGLSAASLALLADAVRQGVHIHSVNLMVMYFGKAFIHQGKSEGELGIDAARRAHDQLAAIDPAIRVGLCPRIGMNGTPAEIFTPADARTLADFALKTPWVATLHYWLVNEDARPVAYKGDKDTPDVPPKPEPWAFAKIFLPFTGSPSPGG